LPLDCRALVVTFRACRALVVTFRALSRRNLTSNADSCGLRAAGATIGAAAVAPSGMMDAVRRRQIPSASAATAATAATGATGATGAADAFVANGQRLARGLALPGWAPGGRSLVAAGAGIAQSAGSASRAAPRVASAAARPSSSTSAFWQPLPPSG
jgi:hypothetical protein